MTSINDFSGETNMNIFRILIKRDIHIKISNGKFDVSLKFNFKK